MGTKTEEIIEDKENRLAVLKLMYQNIQEITENIYSGVDGEDQVIFDVYGNEYLRTEGRKQDIQIKNNTVIINNNVSNNIVLINIKNGAVKEIKGTQRNIKELGKYILIEPSWRYKAELVDTYTTEIIDGGDTITTDKVYVQKLTDKETVLKHWCLYAQEYRPIKIDVINNKIRYFDMYSPFENIQKAKHHMLVATSKSISAEVTGEVYLRVS